MNLPSEVLIYIHPQKFDRVYLRNFSIIDNKFTLSAFKGSNRPMKPEFRKALPRKPVWFLGQPMSTVTTENDQSDTSAVQPILTCDEIQTSDTSAVQPSAVQPILTCDEIQTSDTSAVQPILTCDEIQTTDTSAVQPILTCDEIQTSDTSAVQPILTCDEIQTSDTSAGQPILTCVEVEVNDSSSGDKVISCKGSKHISLVQISPLPCSTAYKQKAVGKRKRKSERSTVLTASPYKASLEEKSASRLTGAKRKLPTPKASSSMEATKSKCKTKRSKRIRKTLPEGLLTCIYCRELYAEPISEDWIQCEKCGKWCHESCAPAEPGVKFVCDYCLRLI